MGFICSFLSRRNLRAAQQMSNHQLKPGPASSLSSGFKEMSTVSSLKLEVSPLWENWQMFVYLLGGKIEKYQPKDIFVLILHYAWWLCSNWKLAIWPALTRQPHTQRISVLVSRYCLTANSVLRSTKLGSSRVFLYPAAAPWFAAQTLERTFASLYFRNPNRNWRKRTSFDLIHFKVRFKC